MDIKAELLRFADGVRHVRRCVEQGTLSEEEASEMCDKLAAFYAAQISGQSGCPDTPHCAGQTSVAEVQGPAREESAAEDEPVDDDTAAVSLLMELGIETLTAHHLASQCRLEEIERWCEYARRSKGLNNPAGLVVSRLRQRVPAPRPAGNGNGRRRYICGEYAEYIQS